MLNTEAYLQGGGERDRTSNSEGIQKFTKNVVSLLIFRLFYYFSSCVRDYSSDSLLNTVDSNRFITQH